uniref:MHC class I-like antigen recognition-like domain-containing protein n=1 Tax=Cyprinus carpio TaxID=7962 RepID=A0A8C2L099_CYPCA
MGTSVVTASFTLLCVFFPKSPHFKQKHSLYYIYTTLSKPFDQLGIYQFTAMGLLDDREIDYYNSEEQKKIPRQHWMKEKMQEDYWVKGTQSRKSKEQWFNVNVDILMKRMRHNESDVHVFQWRHGCEIEKEGSEIKFSKGINEYSYNGANFLSFDDKQSQWIAPVAAALPTKRKWDNEKILNQYTKGYLEKECVKWLYHFKEYGEQELKKGSPPEVYVFAKSSTTDKTKKYRSPLPEDEIESSGVRPNHDGTYQLKKSVDIPKDVKAEYDCVVNHSTLNETIIKWDGTCPDCGGSPVTGIVIGAVLVIVLVGAVFLYLYMTKRLSATNGPVQGNHANEVNENLLPGYNSNGHAPTAVNGGKQLSVQIQQKYLLFSEIMCHKGCVVIHCIKD